MCGQIIFGKYNVQVCHHVRVVKEMNLKSIGIFIIVFFSMYIASMDNIKRLRCRCIRRRIHIHTIAPFAKDVHNKNTSQSVASLFIILISRYGPFDVSKESQRRP